MSLRHGAAMVLDAMQEMVVLHEVVLGPGGAPVDYRLLDCNAAFSRITGIAREAAVGRLASEVYGGTPYLDVFARVALSGVPETFEAYYAPMDRHFAISVVCPGPGRFGTITSDVSGRRRAEVALHRYQLLAESSQDIVLFIRRDDGRILEANAAALAVYGYTREELLGLTVLDLREEVARGASAAQMAAADEHGFRFETVHRRKDGTTFPVEVTSRGASLEGTRVLMSLVRDVTERKAAEAERERLQARLAEAQKLESLGRLAGGIAHDFNNLLTVVLSCAELLRSDLARGPGARLEDLEDITAAGERARELTGQLLAFARRQVVAPIPLDLNALVSGSEKLLRRVLGEDVRVVVRLGAGLGAVRCDPGQLEQVIMNLAVNARDAMPSGGTLTLETSSCAGPESGPGSRPCARLAVADTGTGMTAEVRQHLFEPFYTTKARGKGNGLGLATVYGIVAQAGGLVRVASELGRGTTVEVVLPCTDEPVRPAAPAVAPAPAAGHETVLVVEDDAAVREVTLRALRGAGYRVASASAGEVVSGRGGEERPIHLLVTDVVMPEADGHAVAQAFRARHPDARVLYVSGYSDEILAHRGILAPGIQLLAKPFTPATLLTRVRAVLDLPPG